MKIFVGNLSTEVTDFELETEFSKYGKVTEVNIIRDMFSQVSKGFGFVEMPSKREAETAIEKMIAVRLKDKAIIVNEARPERNNKGRRR